MSANLLLIDDEVVTLSVTKMMLEQRGYDIQVTQSTSEAISILTRIRIDLILLDISMPNLDGFDFVKLMQSLRLTIPVIFVSGTVCPTTPQNNRCVDFRGCVWEGLGWF